MYDFTVTFKTPGCSYVSVEVTAHNGKYAKWLASIELTNQGYSRQCHMWPTFTKRH